MARPRIAIHLQNFADGDGNWGAMLDRARAADAAGVDRVLVSDHVVLGENLEAYARREVGGIEGGRQPTGPDGQWLEPLTVLSVVSGITERVRLGTSVLLAALRRPAVLAKTLATLDVLSNGRVDLGVGVGWQREEYETAGLPFEGRGARLDQALAVCQTLWAKGPATFDDGDLAFESIHCAPRPIQPGGVPVWVGGRSNAAVIARIARFGVGWIPWADDATDPEPGIRAIRQAMEDASRDPTTLQVLGTLPVNRTASREIDVPQLTDQLGRSFEAGVTDFRVSWPIPRELDAAIDVLRELVDIVRRASPPTGD